jgi:photosystem II stability/assembly factor-like uncharacterized protein
MGMGTRRLTLSAIGVITVISLCAGSMGATGGATPTSELHPQIVTSAPGTRDVFAFVVSSSYKHSNVVERSTDGGASFRPMGSIPLTTAPQPQIDPINQLVFTSATTGFAVSTYQSPFFLTRDGGRVWTKESIPGMTDVQQIATTKAYVYAVAGYCPNTAVRCTAWRLERSPLSSLRWTSERLPSPLSRFGSGLTVTAFGSAVWLTTMSQVKPYGSYVGESRDLGRSFHVTDQSLLNTANSCSIQAMSYDVLWAMCDDGNMHGQIIYSDDGGNRWVVDESNSELSQYEFGTFDPVNARLAIADNNLHAGSLLAVTNASATPSIIGAIPNDRSAGELDYLDRRDGVMLTQGIGPQPTSIVWYTDDGGIRWRKVL